MAIFANFIITLLSPLILGTTHAQEHQYPLTDHSALSIPLIGFGTWNLDPSSGNATAAVSFAIQYGYRHIDCAAAYNNEKEVGKGIADGLKRAGLTRKDIWVTSKLWNDHHASDLVEKGLDTSISNLGVDYLDLFLMHWPVGPSPNGRNRIDYLDAWHAMEKLHRAGKARNIGISNFSPTQLKDLIQNSNSKPAAHQFELHPYLPQKDWVQWHADHGIHVTAYSPLANTNPTYGSPKDGPPPLLENEVMEGIAEKRGCTTAQVALAWAVQSRGTSVIPKSKHEDRIKENLDSEKCVLKNDDLERIEKLGRKPTRFNNPGKSWGVKLYEGLEDS
ncbi:MAG: hypothetical protein M1836_003410 [Candelina mexicana]|nr:MAG: hypothetical protein M1836_003410 [Candelina mexicana]